METKKTELDKNQQQLGTLVNAILKQSKLFSEFGVINNGTSPTHFYAIPKYVFADMVKEGVDPDSIGFQIEIPYEPDIDSKESLHISAAKITQEFFFAYLKGGRELVLTKEAEK